MKTYSEKYIFDKETISSMMNKNKDLLRVSEDVQEDKEFLKTIISYNPRNYFLLNEKNKNDIDIVLHTLKEDFSLSERMNKSLFSNKENIIKICKMDRRGLDLATKNLQDDISLVKIAVKAFGSSIMYASKRIQEIKEVVLIAIQSNPNSLRFISSSLRNDKSLIDYVNKTYNLKHKI